MTLRIMLPALLAVFVLAACGKKEESAPAQAPAPAPAPASTPAPAPAPAAEPAKTEEASKPEEAAKPVAAAPADPARGEKVFKQTCATCHQTGLAGAPKIGDKADWGPRIAKGADTLHTHAIKGFIGSKGVMPPKGGNPSLSDDDVKAAVDYMAGKAG